MKRTVDPADSLKTLAAALAPFLIELLELEQENNAEDWLDVAEELPTCKRALYRACRRAELPGRRIKRRWLVRRRDLDAWVESHETGAPPPPPPPKPPPPPRQLTPAEQHEKDVDDMLRQLKMRRLTDAERAAKGLPPYDINREYEEHLEKEKQREQERLEKERADNDPEVAARRAANTRAIDEARQKRAYKTPRVRCVRCRRLITQRKDGHPIAHPCPHGYSYRCHSATDDEHGSIPACPWCAKEIAEPEKAT